ncbi:MAG: hypothetical protein ACC656_10165, partial [Candidatus Heimdallarchaeota archaeon]
MQQLLLSTTGVASTVVIDDLGRKTFTHPTANFDLLSEFDSEELRDSNDLQTAIDNNFVTVFDETNYAVPNIQTALDSGKLAFDKDRDDVVDNTQRLGDEEPSYYTTSVNIDYDPTTSGLSSNNVQDAIDEVEQRVDVNDAKVSADGSIDTHLDVDTTTSAPGLGDFLQWDGAIWIPGSSSGAPVDSVFGRIGDIIAVAGDYDATQITYDNAGSGLAATDTQGAIDEVLAAIPQDTDDLAEGIVNFYYTETRVNANFATKTTNDLTEGSINLYYTDQRVTNRLNVSSIDELVDVDTGTSAPLTDQALEWNGTMWVPKTTVNIVNGYNQSIVDLVTDDIPESGTNATNLWYTDARVKNYLDNIAGLRTIDVYQNLVTSSISSTTAVDIVFDEFRQVGGAFTYTPPSAEITIAEDGFFVISFNVSFSLSSSNQRSTS